MTPLEDFQSKFLNAVVSENLTEDFTSDIIPGGTLTHPEDPLQLHRHGYIARLTEALGETYESVWWFLGDDLFFELCQEYIGLNPSQTDNLSNYGKDFPVFLQNHKQSRDLEFLYDLGCFEWIFKNVFHQSSHIPYPLNRLDTFEDVFSGRLYFGPSVQTYSSKYQVYDLWKFRKASQDDVPDLPTEPKTSNYVFFKKSENIHIINLNNDEIVLMEKLMSKRLVSKILTDLESENDQITNAVTQVFQKVFTEGLVENIALETSGSNL